jgi:co-chaperonin GroES (HSP10)
MTEFDGTNIPPEQLPVPKGWQILLAPIKITEETAGGIILVKEEVKHQETVRFISKVLAVGPLAYSGDKFKVHPKAPKAEPWCKVGDIVSTGQYTGSQIPCMSETGDKFYLRLVADDEIKTVIPSMEIIDAK